jgi:hypothetical protein
MKLAAKQIMVVTTEQLEEFAEYIVHRTIEAINAPINAAGQSEYLNGLDGICRLFGVSRVTAQRYKDTFLRPAVDQRGRKIRINVALANKLFAEHENIK